jgi:hypothetical protein
MTFVPDVLPSTTEVPTEAQYEARWQLWKADARMAERRRVDRVRILAGVVAFALVVYLLTMVI